MAAPNTAAAPPSLAALVQAGANPTQAQSLIAQRQFLAQMLASMMEGNGPNIRTPFALGANLLADAIAQRGYNRSNQVLAALQQQIAQARYPNDPNKQLLYLTAPDDVNKAEAARSIAPIDVRQTNTVLNAPTPSGIFTAPALRDDGGVFSTQTPTGVQITGTRPPNYSEQTAQAGQAETGRHNQAMEGIDLQKIPIELGMMRAALGQAGAALQNSNTTLANSQNVAPPPGFRIVGGP